MQLGKDCDYERELRRLQVELVKLQEWFATISCAWWCCLKGATRQGRAEPSSGITESLNPRICRVVALGIATEREKRQW